MSSCSRRASSLALFFLACGDAGGATESATSTSSTSSTSSTAASSSTGASSGPTGTASEGGTSSTSVDPTGVSSTTGSPKLDVGAALDFGVIPDPGEIPATCAEAGAAATTIGCRFYALDLDNYTPWDTSQWGVAVANVQARGGASVTVELKNGGVWEVVAGPETIPAGSLHVFELPDRHQEGSGLQPAGAFRITADVPVIAYQFGPLGNAMDVAWASADASLLHPSAAWDTLNHVVGMISTSYLLPQQGAYLSVVAGHDGTVVTITPSVATLAGPGVPAGAPGVPFQLALDEGDVVEIMTKTQGAALTGTRVASNDDHPVGVFSGHECANIPADVYACDHLEEQMPGLRRWGTSFVAARMPVRALGTPEPSLWQIYASEDDTSVTLTASPGVTGLPQSPLTLAAGEVAEFYVGGAPAEPGDFLVASNKPIAVANYMTSQDNVLDAGKTGDPAMVLLSPVEQFLPRYVVLVPGVWPADFATITRPTGVPVTIDGVAVADAEFAPVGPDFEVARVPVADGVHLIEADEPFSIVIAGIHQTGSYAYLGGTSTAIINPEPAG